MYQLGKREKDKRRQKIIWRCLLVLLILVIATAGWLLRHGLPSHTTIKQSSAKVTKVSFSQEKTKRFDEPNFSFSLPTDWEASSHDTSPYDVFRFRGTGKLSKNRQLEIYQDTIPLKFAVNRVLAIESGSEHITLRGSVSDNCADFTKGSREGPIGTKAKWQNIDFLCDLANYERNVVGTSSVDGINSVLMIGPTTGKHYYFFSYTENSFNADYSVFYTALQSFTLK